MSDGRQKGAKKGSAKLDDKQRLNQEWSQIQRIMSKTNDKPGAGAAGGGGGGGSRKHGAGGAPDKEREPKRHKSKK
jgi:hypothetical protein